MQTFVKRARGDVNALFNDDDDDDDDGSFDRPRSERSFFFAFFKCGRDGPVFVVIKSTRLI